MSAGQPLPTVSRYLENFDRRRGKQRVMMKIASYNDIAFALEKNGNSWAITRQLPDGASAIVGAGLFPDAQDSDALAKAQMLVRTIYPVGIELVGPDVNHPSLVGDLKIVFPDVSHPNFIYWNKDSTSFAR